MTENLLSLVKKDCVLFEVASKPYGINNELVKKYRLSLVTLPSDFPGKTAPKSALGINCKKYYFLFRKGMGKMAHNFKDKNIGVGITGSYCTYKKVFEELRRLADTQANLFTIFSRQRLFY